MKFAVIARKPRNPHAETIIEGRQYETVDEANVQARGLRVYYEDVTLVPIPSVTAIDWRTRGEEYAA